MLKGLFSRTKQKIDKTFNQFVAAVFVASQLIFPMVAMTPAHATNDEKVRICHATGSDSNQFTSNEVNDDAIDGNGNSSSDHNRNDHQDGEDIIPPFYVNGDPGTWTSRNWDAEGQAIWNNGCSTENSIKIVKDAQPNSSTNFSFEIDKQNSSWDDDFSLRDDGNDPNNTEKSEEYDELSAGIYDIVEDGEDGWVLSSITCDNQTYTTDLEDKKATVTVGIAENVTCTFVNTPAPTFGSVKVNKKVDADGNGIYEGSNGTADSLGFAWGLDAETADNEMGSTQSNVPTGQHTIHENSVSGFVFTGWYFTDDYDDEGSRQVNCSFPQGTSLPAEIEVKKNEKTEITLCNQKVHGGDVVVIKLIDKDGNLNTTNDRDSGYDWQFNIAGTIENTDIDGQVTVEDVPVGDNYSVTETVKNGYRILGAWCDSGQNGQFNADKKAVEGIEIKADDTVNCTFVNALKPATLHATKIVCDNESYLPNWGTGGFDNPPIGAGTADAWLAVGDRAQHCKKVTWDFQWMTEPSTNPGDEVGEAGGPWAKFSGSTQIPAGGTVWVREVFENGYIGFTGQTTTEGAEGSAEIYCHNDVLNFDNWEFVANVQPEQSYYCVAWNVVDKPTLTVKKEIVNQGQWGGELKVTDFPLYVNGQLVVHNQPTDANVGLNVFWEQQQDGYKQVSITGEGCYEFFHGIGLVNLDIGEDRTCTIQNEEIPGSITVYKTVRNDDGGYKDAEDFDLFIDYDQVVHGDKNYLPVGKYTISETEEHGYELKYINCYVKKHHFASLHGLLNGNTNGWEQVDWEYQGQTKVWLDLDEHITCVVKNDDIPAKVIVKKFTLDGGHNPFISDEKFEFEVENKTHNWEDYDFYLDTNPGTHNIKNYKEIELKKPGLIKVSEDRERGWITYVHCFKRGQEVPQILSQDNVDANSLNSYGFNGMSSDNSETEWVGNGDTLICIFLNVEKGEIDVIKYNDLNQNGQRDEDEPKLEDWKFYLDKCYGYETFTTELNGNGNYCYQNDNFQNFSQNGYNHCYGGHDYCEKTDEHGRAEFENLKPFQLYKLSEKLQDGWTQGNISCDYGRGYDGQPNGGGVLNGYNEYLIFVKPGSEIKCEVGNYQNAHYNIAKTNDSTDALVPGQSANFTITVSVPEDSGIVYGAQVYDLMPAGLTYVNGTAKIDGAAAVPEPDYSGPGEAVWELGDLNPGDVRELTYTAIIDDNTPAGTYTNVAWTDGERCTSLSIPRYQGELSIVQTEDGNYEEYCREFEEIQGNVDDACFEEKPEEVVLFSYYGEHDEQTEEEPNCDPFVESSVTVAAVLGETETEVLAETGTPAILAPFVGLSLIGAAVLAGGGNRRFKRLLGRLNRGMLAGLMSLALMLFSIAPAMAATNNVWKLKVADLAETTTLSSLDLSYSVASTNSASSTTVELEVDGPGSNDMSDSEVVTGSASQSFEVELPVTGEYDITVSATGSGTLIGDGIVAQTVTRENPPEPTVVTVSGTTVTQEGNTHTVAFTVPEGSDAETVQIYASTDPNSEGELVGEIPATPGALQTFVHNAANAAGLFFTIRLVDGDGNTSTLASSIGSQESSSADDGVVSDVAATDDQSANDDEGQEQAATDDQSDEGNNTALVIIGLAAVAGALYYVFGRRSGVEE